MKFCGGGTEPGAAAIGRTGIAGPGITGAISPGPRIIVPRACIGICGAGATNAPGAIMAPERAIPGACMPGCIMRCA